MLKHVDFSIIIFVVILTILCGWTLQRNTAWKDGPTLWLDVISKSPNKGRPYLALAKEYAIQGRLREANMAADIACAIVPEFEEIFKEHPDPKKMALIKSWNR